MKTNQCNCSDARAVDHAVDADTMPITVAAFVLTQMMSDASRTSYEIDALHIATWMLINKTAHKYRAKARRRLELAKGGVA